MARIDDTATQPASRRLRARTAPLAAVLAMLMAAMLADASAQPAPPAEPAASAPANLAGTAAIDMAQATQRVARSSAEWLARSIDGWFGDEPFPRVERVADGRMDIGLYKREGDNAALDLRFDARFRLPNLERRAYLFIGRDDRRDAVQDTPDDVALRQRLRADGGGERSFLAGLGLGLLPGLDARVGLSASAQPYAQLRWRQRWRPQPAQSIDLRQTVFATRADRLGSTTALGWDWQLAPRWTLRWFNAATLTQARRGWAGSSSLSVQHDLDGARLLTAEAVLASEGTRAGGTGSSERGLLLKWEQALHEDWLRGELVLGHFWPRASGDADISRAWALGAAVKLRF